MTADQSLADFAQKHGLTILLPFTSLGAFDAKTALLVSPTLLVNVSYDRGSAFISAASTSSPSLWFEIPGVLEFRGSPRAPSPQKSTPFDPDDLMTFDEAVTKGLEEANPVIPFLREKLAIENRGEFVRQWGKFRRRNSVKVCPVCGRPAD